MGLAAQRRKLLAGARRDRPAWKTAARPAPASGRRRAPCGRDALAATALAFSRASSAAATRHRRARRAPRPRARRYRAGSISTGMPAASSIARRAALFEASTKGRAASHSDMMRPFPTSAGCRRRSASSAITSAAVSSIERRVTSMIGQLCLPHSLRDAAISSATACRSTYSSASCSARSPSNRFCRICTIRSGLAVKPTTSGCASASSFGGTGMPGTSGKFAVLTPRLAR